MNTIRVTKEFRFEMAHALLNHDGPCRNIHGHSYQLSVTVKGSPVELPGHSKDGMLIDFSDLKRLVEQAIVHPFDHALVLHRDSFREIFAVPANQKTILTDFQPTIENLILYCAEKLTSLMPAEVTLHHLLLRETATSYAEWFAEDNPR